MFRLLAAGAAAAAMAGLAGCSAPADPGSDPSPESESTSTSVPSVGHGSLAYCLSEHGVSAGPGPAPGPPPGVDEQTWHDAMSECSSLAPGPPG
ncbi:MAG: hypothetical protein SW019_24870 [Actinomycetota bacterium]|nr:hypothetical protein [Actinomycetota bacterium]